MHVVQLLSLVKSDRSPAEGFGQNHVLSRINS